MNLADHIAQCVNPFVICDSTTGQARVLNNAADFAQVLPACAVRYVLSDDLTRLCADLAYSHGARSLGCADLLRIPATSLWVEWSNQPWEQALQRYGFSLDEGPRQWAGRRGALLSATADGRRGLLRTFWSNSSNTEPSASSMEAYFDFDVEEGEDPTPPDGNHQKLFRVRGDKQAEDDLLSRCFRFRFERTWANYYAQSSLSDCERSALWQHCLGTIAVDIPMLTAFLLLLSIRNTLPQSPRSLQRLNAARLKSGKRPLLDHIEVRAPLIPAYQSASGEASLSTRRSPRLHHVRGHLMRRGYKLIWRVPHLRGSARAGARLQRTVTWTVDAGRDADTCQP